MSRADALPSTLADLAVAEAVRKVASERASDLRMEAADGMASIGAKSMKVDIGGVAVGTATLMEARRPVVTDDASFYAWARESGAARMCPSIDMGALTDEERADLVAHAEAVHPGCTSTGWVLSDNWHRLVRRDPFSGLCYDGDGQLVPGCAWPSEPSGIRLTGAGGKALDPAAVGRALSVAGGATVAGMLCGEVGTDGDAPDA